MEFATRVKSRVGAIEVPEGVGVVGVVVVVRVVGVVGVWREVSSCILALASVSLIGFSSG
jgi:hypothetical protein